MLHFPNADQAYEGTPLAAVPPAERAYMYGAVPPTEDRFLFQFLDWEAKLELRRRFLEPFARKPLSRAVRALARVDHGRWLADCPFDGCRSAQLVSPNDPRFFCPECLNAQVAGAFVAVEWPAEPEKVEALLARRPSPANRNWIPTETLADLRAENAANGVR